MCEMLLECWIKITSNTRIFQSLQKKYQEIGFRKESQYQDFDCHLETASQCTTFKTVFLDLSSGILT